MSQVWDQASYLGVWVVVGIGMRCCLYDAAFAALVQVTPSRGRKAISYLTLYGAYASTVFWVVGHYLNEGYGWRGTLIAFAAINLVICLPLNWLGFARRDPPRTTATPRGNRRHLRRMDPCSKGACALLALFFSRSSCRSTDSSLASSRSSWCRCWRQRDWPEQRPFGLRRSRAMASLLAVWSRFSLAATSRP